MASASHGAAPSAVGYQHQIWWDLVKLLRPGAGWTDAAISLELHDDVAWERDGTPTQLLQVKHHQNTHRASTDASTDVWRTLNVWMDTAVPGGATGPELLVVTTQTAAPSTAVAALRPETLDERAALTGLKAVATSATSEQTKVARQQFLALTRQNSSMNENGSSSGCLTRSTMTPMKSPRRRPVGRCCANF